MLSRVFFITFAVANLGLILYGIMAILSPGVLLDSFSEEVYQFPVAEAEAIRYLSGVFRLIGYFNLVLGVLGLLVLRRFQTTDDRWLMKLVILSTAVAYVGPVVFDNTVGSIGFFEIVEHIIFVAILIVGSISLRSSMAGSTGQATT